MKILATLLLIEGIFATILGVSTIESSGSSWGVFIQGLIKDVVNPLIGVLVAWLLVKVHGAVKEIKGVKKEVAEVKGTVGDVKKSVDGFATAREARVDKAVEERDVARQQTQDMKEVAVAQPAEPATGVGADIQKVKVVKPDIKGP